MSEQDQARGYPLACPWSEVYYIRETSNSRYFTLDEEGNPEADDPNKLTIDDEDEGFEEFDVDGEVEMDQMDWL